MNVQPIEKLITRKDTLDVHSIFETIQGEGPYSGQRAMFVRLAGCNLQCPGCDTDYTSARQQLKPLDIVQRCCDWGYSLVVITGGEPFRQPIGQLTEMLHGLKFTVQIETNGVLPIPKGLDPNTTIVVSPKTDRIADWIYNSKSIYFKYVLQSDNISDIDGLPIQALENKVSSNVARPPEGFNHSRIFVTPFDEKDDGKNRANMDTALASCKKHGYTLQLQIHKYYGIE